MSNLDYNHEEINDTLARLAANLDNLTAKIEPLMNEEMKRVKLPIPEEYGGGYVYGNGYSEAARKLADVVKDRMLISRSGPLFKDCWEKWISLKEGLELRAGGCQGSDELRERSLVCRVQTVLLDIGQSAKITFALMEVVVCLLFISFSTCLLVMA